MLPIIAARKIRIGMGSKEEPLKIIGRKNEKAMKEEGDTATDVGGILKKPP
ncbi:MAG: hypothetical protein Q6358_09195 [Candidatus Brocadiales bacterium]|uniref:hypothetical protein n=1 Tax=Candidatus Wunengus sp. YC60 TaxID=3367697 RepID=UPI002714126C|nr:hypothetical protein [Candidatus Brocadiales bacterium]